MGKLAKKLAPIYRSLYFPPAVIFVAVMAATIIGWQAANAALNQDITSSANLQADDAEQSLREHMVAYEQVLRGGAGLFQSSEEVTLEEWESFLRALSVDRGFSGVQGIGFIRILTKDDLPEIKNFMAEQGVENFEITPVEPPRDQYSAIVYIHSVDFAQNLPYGYDAATEPARRSAMEKARDTSSIVMTPAIDLLPPDPNGVRTGFSMYGPYYDADLPSNTTEEKRKSIRGYVYASFLASDFFADIIGGENDKNEGFLVTAKTDSSSRTMYRSKEYDAILNQKKTEHVERDIRLYGQTWTINFVARESTLVSEEQLARPSVIMFFGSLSAALVSVIVLLLIRARARDLSTQKERAVELAKDELLSLASHQLRTPATGVKQYIGMVLQGFAGKVPNTQKKLLEKAYASNDRQLRIINEILHLAKIDAGRIVLAKQRTNLNELVSDVVNEQRPDIETAKHDISVILPKKELIIFADTHILRMAVENLLSNAIKYTPNGGRIIINVRKVRNQARIEVTDTGVGISPEDRDKIFRQFSRLSNVMSQQVGGTGIGLYLAKHLVELHDGRVTVDSEVDKGSTFTISLPLRVGST